MFSNTAAGDAAAHNAYDITFRSVFAAQNDMLRFGKENYQESGSYGSTFSKWYSDTRESWEPRDPDYAVELMERQPEAESGLWYEPASKAAGWGIIGAAGVEYSPFREWTVGSNWKLYRSGWGGGSRGLVKTAEIEEVAHGVGILGVAVAETFDAGALWNYYKHGPDSPNSITPAHAASNLGVALAAYPLGIIGALGGGAYFAIDSQYRGGMREFLIDSSIIQENGGLPVTPRF